MVPSPPNGVDEGSYLGQSVPAPALADSPRSVVAKATCRNFSASLQREVHLRKVPLCRVPNHWFRSRTGIDQLVEGTFTPFRRRHSSGLSRCIFSCVRRLLQALSFSSARARLQPFPLDLAPKCSWELGPHPTKCMRACLRVTRL